MRPTSTRWTEHDPGLPPGTICVVGPTASGKSAVAMLLAERLGGQIVTADSVQVYRGMDIGTAKPGADERARVPVHMIDVVDVDDPYDVARYCRDARSVLAGLHREGIPAIIDGGSGLYVRGLIQGVFDGAPAAPELRARLEEIARRNGPAALVDRLRELDPDAAAAIDANNVRRLVRAIEICERTGRPLSEVRTQWSGPAAGALFGIARERSDLVARIDRRVDAMFDRGWIEEVRGLAATGLRANPSASRAVGYRQILEHLDGGRPGAGLRDAVKTATRRLARRQLTWFRRQTSVHWVPTPDDAPPQKAVEAVLREMHPLDR